MSEAEKLLKQVKKDLGKQKEPTLSVTDIMQDAYAGLHSEESMQRMYGADAFRVKGEEKGLLFTAGSTTAEDLAVQEAIRKNRLIPVRADSVESELEFREKEKCYGEKERNQEKAAMERNKDLSRVDTSLLRQQISMLKTELAATIDPEDSLAVAKRTYQTEYLAAIQDLMETQNKKGKLLGNYKSHIALAKEKYCFYRDHADRIIGRNMAEIIKSRPEYQTKVSRVQQSLGGVPDFDLTKLFDRDQTARSKIDSLSKEEREKLKKAILEYKESSLRANELIASLQAMDDLKDEEISGQIDTVFQNDRELVEEMSIKYRKLNRMSKHAPIPDAEVKKLIKERLMLDSQAARGSYRSAIEAEVRALQFHAGSGLLCVRYLLSKGDPQAAQLFREGGDVLFTHAGYLQKHFGVDIPGGNEQLRKLNIGGRVGYESSDSDISESLLQSPLQDVRDSFSDTLKRKVDEVGTGYLKQQAFEATVMEYATEKVYRDHLRRNRQEKDGRPLRRECEEVTLLTRPLPGVVASRKLGAAPGSREVDFLGTRDKKGVFQVGAFAQPNQQMYEHRILPEFERHFKNLRVLRDSEDSSELRVAIREELKTVEDAFTDIDAFMTVGLTAEIFKGKSHEDIFRNTAGLPTFQRKATALRDVLSRMLRHGDLISQLEQEGYEGLRKDLTYRLGFMNRVVRFVQNRVELMNRGYNSTLSDWSADKCELNGFWDGDIPAKELLDEEATAEFLGIVHTLADKERQRRQDGAGDRPEQDDAAPAIPAVVPKTAEEQQEDAGRQSIWEQTLRAQSLSAQDTQTMSLSKYESSSFSDSDAQIAELTRDLMGSSAHLSAEEAEKKARSLLSMIKHPSLVRKEEAERRWNAGLGNMPERERRFLNRQYYEDSCASREEQQEAIEKDLLKGTIHSDCVASRSGIEAELKKLEREAAGAGPADRSSIDARIRSLRTQKEDMDLVIASLREDVKKRAAQLLRLVKAPVAAPTQGEVRSAGHELLLMSGGAQKAALAHAAGYMSNGKLDNMKSDDTIYEVSRIIRSRIMMGPAGRSGVYEDPKVIRLNPEGFKGLRDSLRQEEIGAELDRHIEHRISEMMDIIGADITDKAKRESVESWLKSRGHLLPTESEIVEARRINLRGTLLQVPAGVPENEATIMKLTDLFRQVEQVRLIRVKDMLIQSGVPSPGFDMIREGERMMRVGIIPAYDGSMPQNMWKAQQAEIMRAELEKESLNRAEEVAKLLKVFPNETDIIIIRDAIRDRLGREMLTREEIEALEEKRKELKLQKLYGIDDYMTRDMVDRLMGGMRSVMDEKRTQAERALRTVKADPTDEEIEEAVQISYLRFGRILHPALVRGVDEAALPKKLQRGSKPAAPDASLSPEEKQSKELELSLWEQERAAYIAQLQDQQVAPILKDAVERRIALRSVLVPMSRLHDPRPVSPVIRGQAHDAPPAPAPAIAEAELSARKQRWQTAVDKLGDAGKAILRVKYPEGFTEDMAHQKEELIRGILADTTYKMTEMDLEDVERELAEARKKLSAGGLTKDDEAELKDEIAGLEKDRTELSGRKDELMTYAQKRADELLSLQPQVAPVQEEKKQEKAAREKPTRLRFDQTVESTGENGGMLETEKSVLDEHDEIPWFHDISDAEALRIQKEELRADSVKHEEKKIKNPDDLKVFTGKEKRIAEFKISGWLKAHVYPVPDSLAKIDALIAEHSADAGADVLGYLNWLRSFYQMFPDEAAADRAAYKRDYAPLR